MLARKVKLQLNKTQVDQLKILRNKCANAYNIFLQMNFDRLNAGEKTLSHFDMCKLSAKYEHFGIGAHIAGMLCQRVDNAMKRYQESEKIKYKFYLQYGDEYRRPLKACLAKTGKKLWGRPRFKIKGISIQFPIRSHHQKRVHVDGKITSVTIPLIGRVKGRNDRQELIGQIKTVTVDMDSCKTWWLTIVCDGEKPKEQIESRSPAIGVDLGLKHTITAANEHEVIQPERERFLEKQMAAIKTASRNNRRDLPFIHRKIARRRKASHHVQSRDLLKAANHIIVGNLSAKFLFSGKLARSASDAAHAQFLSILSYKAANAGKTVKIVNESGTSQTCFSCGKKHKLTLADRHFECACGYSRDRDVNAALNILKIGRVEAASGATRKGTRV